MLTLISAHRYEDLQARLLSQLLQPGTDLFDAEPVLVPSAAMRQQVTQALADRHGVCTQVEFSFLAQWLWRQIADRVPGIPEHSPFDPESLRWRILRLLEEPGLRVRHPRLEVYLVAADERMRFDLAERIAGLFDQYLTYRPDWLEAWSRGSTRASRKADGVIHADECWQAELWRGVLAALGGQAEHPAQDFLQALGERPRAAGAPSGALPPRLHVFCVPTMPPLYLRLLRSLADHIDVHLYVINPCREYWLDLISLRSHAHKVLAGEADYHAVGHRLLSAWGRQTQAYLHLLLAEEGEMLLEDLDASLPEESPSAARIPLLAGFQSSIEQLQDLQPGSLHTRCAPDESLVVHVCHSLVRELEVLQDALLARLSAADAPLPSEILVVVPNLELAAPLIDGVFANPPPDCYIPYVTTGVAPAQASPLARALLLLLDTVRGRLPLSAVLALLQQPLIGQRFGLTGEALDELAEALREAGVHWGFDAAHRAALSLPATARHTLTEGRARLWLGYALPDRHASPWLGQLPAGARQGEASLLLGAFDVFLERLGQARQRLSGDLTPEAWYGALIWLMDTFFVDLPEGRDEALSLRAELDRQRQALRDAGVSEPVPLAILLLALTQRFEGPARGGVPGGAVTFAAMSSLRNLPHRVICVLGLNDGDFPHAVQPIEFDLLARYPRAGDRQRGEDERNLFLDLLLAARGALHLSYSGRSARDNSHRPPSVLLSELLDTLVPALCAPDATPGEHAAMRAELVHVHPLQPFDESYFLPDAGLKGGAGLLSYRSPLAAALRARSAAQSGATDTARGEFAPAMPSAKGAASAATVSDATPPSLPDTAATQAEGRELDLEESLDDEDALDEANVAPFFAAPLPPPGPEWRVLPLEQLIRFLHNPARVLLRDRLGLILPAHAVEWGDSEDFLPERHAAAQLGARLLPALLDDLPPFPLEALAAAGQEYPEGPLGDTARALELDRLRAFAATLRAQQSGAPLPAQVGAVALTIQGETWTIDGTAEGLFAVGDTYAMQSDARYQDLTVRVELEAWVRHLWLAAQAPLGRQWTTRWLLRDTALTYRPLGVEHARACLATLLGMYREGLSFPLHFFPKSSRRFQETGRLADARKVWQSSPYQAWGEDRDPAYKLALRAVPDPLDAQFEACARAVFDPLVAARDEGASP